ncbi:MAG TPA: class I SAM-dependent methyltransferase [Sphingomicrobium sp.]
MTLLIHSMSELSEIILSALDTAGATNVVEIGAEFGGMSQLLADFTAERGGTLTSIDPCVKPEFTAWLSQNPSVRHVAQPSLDAIPSQGGVDAWIVDGDHNYYTVYHELHGIDAACRRDGKPLLAFLHDVNWPCARRDSYYVPERIPAEWRHPYDYDGGATLDSEDLVPGQGFRGEGQFAFATHSGGPRNGVLTAVEDFIDEAGRAGADLSFAFVPAVFGLGILFDSGAPWSPQLAQAVIPFHRSPLLQSMEDNRLRNYLRVLELQDASF